MHCPSILISNATVYGQWEKDVLAVHLHCYALGTFVVNFPPYVQ